MKRHVKCRFTLYILPPVAALHPLDLRDQSGGSKGIVQIRDSPCPGTSIPDGEMAVAGLNFPCFSEPLSHGLNSCKEG